MKDEAGFVLRHAATGVVAGAAFGMLPYLVTGDWHGLVGCILLGLVIGVVVPFVNLYRQ